MTPAPLPDGQDFTNKDIEEQVSEFPAGIEEMAQFDIYVWILVYHWLQNAKSSINVTISRIHFRNLQALHNI